MRIAALLFFGLTLFAQDPSKGVNFYSLEKERALWEQIARDYRAQATLIENAELLGRIEAIGRSLIPAESKYTYTFALTASENTLLQEPVAFPGGFIFVPAGLILGAQNADELAGMIAHSVAHIEARHGTRQATKAQIVDQATIPLIYMGGWTGYAMRQGTALSIPLGMLKGVRAHELEADSLAAHMMAAAGFQPALLADYIERVQPPDSDPPDAHSTLPSRAERVAVLRAAPAPAAAPGAAFDLKELQELLRRALPKKAKTAPRLAR